MIQYYQRIASFIIPHIKNRPISMQRFPNGIDGEGFYQKDASGYFPEWIKLFDIEKGDKTKVVHHVLCNDVQTLVYLANQAVITPHIWLSKVNNIHYPDRLIFDLDPPSIKQFPEICKAAKLFKNVLENLGLHPFVMTTGSKGLHVVVPIKPNCDFEYVRTFARQLAELLVQQHPQHLTVEIRKDKREGRIFVDYLRNAWAQTGVAPYAVRAKEGAPIATPLQWKEVNSQLSSQKYTIKNIFRRVSRIGDPWQDIDAHAKSIKSIKL
jgi:bifunctional non-homologous end joining protein LigD